MNEAHPINAVTLTHRDWQMDFAYTAENLPRILALRGAMLAQSDVFRKTPAWEKGMSRLEDARQIAAREMTAAEVQGRNSLFTDEQVRATKIAFDPVAFQKGNEMLLAYVLAKEVADEPLDIFGPYLR